LTTSSWYAIKPGRDARSTAFWRIKPSTNITRINEFRSLFMYSWMENVHLTAKDGSKQREVKPSSLTTLIWRVRNVGQERPTHS
jgi:hypothetical protein